MKTYDMKTFARCLSLILLIFISTLKAQKLKPGFDKKEYLEMLKIAQKQALDTAKWKTKLTVPDPIRFKQLYRSPIIGIENQWDLWMSNDSVAVISVRGTTADPNSWLPNLYAAMVPAKGELKLSKTFTFQYNLSPHPKAAVHVGWLISAAFISKDLLPKIDSCYHKRHIKNFILTGHSQGGGITFLLSSYLHSLQVNKQLPDDIRFKTYCSAGPKPGNLYFAYSYEHDMSEGWAFNVVNTADWVPEVPFSIQTKHDFNKTNGLMMADNLIKKQKLIPRMAMKHVYKKLTKPGLKAQKNYENYLGKMVSKSIKKLYPDFEPPAYFQSNNYVRTGHTIVLWADDAYYKIYPDSETNMWQHHFIEPYLLLAEKLPD